jgi:hypothetical protein
VVLVVHVLREDVRDERVAPAHRKALWAARAWYYGPKKRHALPLDLSRYEERWCVFLFFFLEGGAARP